MERKLVMILKVKSKSPSKTVGVLDVVTGNESHVNPPSIDLKIPFDFRQVHTRSHPR